MAGMIKNIFGLNTQDVADQRAELNRLKSAQRIKQGDIDPTVAILGQQFGDMLGRGLMKKLGYEDTEMAQAEANEAKQKQLQEDLSKLDSSSAEYYYRMAEAYVPIDPVKAGQLAVIANNIKDKKDKESEKANKKDSFLPTVPSDNLLDLTRNEIMADRELMFAGNMEGVDDYELNNYAADLSSRATKVISDINKKAKKEGIEINIPDYNTIIRKLIEADKGPRDEKNRQVNDNNRITLESGKGFFDGMPGIDFSYNPNK